MPKTKLIFRPKKVLKSVRSLQALPLLATLFVWYGVMWSWVFVAKTDQLAGGRLQGKSLAVLVWLVNVCLSSLIAWKAVNMVRFVHKKYSSGLFLALALVLFALTDFLVAWLTALVWIGPQGSLDTVLPLGSLALLVLQTPLRLAAGMVGFYGLAAFLWLFIFLLSHKETRRLAPVPVVALTLLSLTGQLLYDHPAGQAITATVISESLDKRVDRLPSNVDLIVFPEYGLENVDNSNLHLRLNRTNSADHKAYFIGSEQSFRPNVAGHANNLMFGNSTDGITSRQPKHRLMPGGEDLSYVGRGLLRATGQTATLDYFTFQKSVNKGSEPLRQLKMDHNIIVAAGLCSSIIAPQDYRQLTRRGATLLTNSASLTVFGGSKVFAWQQKSLGRFMAVANARYFLQSANASSAYVLDQKGKLVTEVRGTKSIDVKVYPSTVTTLYTSFGEWLPWAGLGALLAVCYQKWKDKHEKTNSKK